MSEKIILCFLILLIAVAFSGCKATQNIEYEPCSEDQTAEESTLDDRIALIASDESENIFLYGIAPKGVVLYIDGVGHYYDWEYKKDGPHSPKIFICDINEDNSDEIAVATFSDSENDSENLYIIDRKNPENAMPIDNSDIDAEVKKQISYEIGAETVTFVFENKNYSFDLSEYFENFNFSGVYFSKNISFSIEDGNIYVSVIPTVENGNEYEGYESVSVHMTVKAKINIDEYGNITMTDLSCKGI